MRRFQGDAQKRLGVTMNLLIATRILMVATFITYWCLLYRMIDHIMESPRLSKIGRFIVGVVFTCVIFGGLQLTQNSGALYFIMLALLVVGYLVFYRDKLGQVLFCTGACILNMLTIRAIAIGVMSLALNSPVLEIEQQRLLFNIYITTAFLLTNVAMLAVTRYVPLNYLRVINKHKEQLWFLLAWMSINICYLFLDICVFEKSSLNPAHPINKIVTSLCILAGFYIVLFFAIKTSLLLGYKEKNVVLEQAVVLEQQYRNSVTKDAITTYEVNVTQDTILNGFEDKREELGDMVTRYSDMLIFMARKIIYSEDIDEFTKYATTENIEKLYESGESETVTEYRRLLETGEYAWVRAVSNLVKDEKTGDLIAFVCIKNIDEQKQRQLELEYKAERDPLTGLYNKEITGKLVDEHLMSDYGHGGSVLFMIDVDNFKSMNDNFSHVYGDAVLCELADKLRTIFRADDIVGRIGGDEFIAYMKNCTSPKKIKAKAEDILRKFHITYNGLEDEGYTISGSVGISISPKDGRNFETLYRFADTALYQAKGSGKNTYKLYDGSDFRGYCADRTEIQTTGAVSQKNFRQNRIEYVFKILYQSDNSAEAIHSVLELVARHFSFARGYIFETSKDGKTTSNTFEWCAQEIAPQIDQLQHIPIAAIETANSHFYKNGTFILRSLDNLQPVERTVLEPQGIKSMFQFGIFDKSQLLGFIGFDNCTNENIPNDTEVDEIATICNVLATFFVKQHIDEIVAQDFKSRQEVMDHLDNYIYVVNMGTFEVLFMNEKTKALMNQNTSGKTACYSFFRGNDQQCEDCPMRQMKGDDSEQIVCEMYNEKLNIWTETKASTLRWTDGGHACLISCADITKQKSEHLLHINQLEQIAYVDELTGSRTYSKFKEDARRILERETLNLHLLVKLDIDNFKLVNQMYGYAKGDEMLCLVARALEKTMRSEQDIFARIGNDEFIALMQIESVEEAATLYNLFLSNFFPLIGDEIVFKFKFPHGRYLVYPGDVDKSNIMDLFEKVNIAHKSAKGNKSLEFVLYDERLTAEALQQNEVENRMESALCHNEFLVYLQPKYQLSDNTVAGAEALARWGANNDDLFLPGAFIPVFEKNGFVTRLDKYLLHKVCAIIQGWIANGIEPVTVSVNFSRLHLGNPQLAEEICEIVDSYGIPHQYIEIEITETAIYDNIETLAVLLDQLHADGFTMSMDDFGSGYSSLGMLQNLPVDVIKMDRCFFVNQKDAQRTYTIVGSVIEMATKLGISIVAEGVEEKEQIDFLRELNCDMAQGYFFAKPMPVHDFNKLLGASEKKEYLQ